MVLTGAANERQQIMECQFDEAQHQYRYFYPGHENDCEDLLETFGNHVRQEGVLDGRTYQPVGGNDAPDAEGYVSNLRYVFMKAFQIFKAIQSPDSLAPNCTITTAHQQTQSWNKII